MDTFRATYGVKVDRGFYAGDTTNEMILSHRLANLFRQFLLQNQRHKPNGVVVVEAAPNKELCPHAGTLFIVRTFPSTPKTATDNGGLGMMGARETVWRKTAARLAGRGSPMWAWVLASRTSRDESSPTPIPGIETRIRGIRLHFRRIVRSSRRYCLSLS